MLRVGHKSSSRKMGGGAFERVLSLYVYIKKEKEESKPYFSNWKKKEEVGFSEEDEEERFYLYFSPPVGPFGTFPLETPLCFRLAHMTFVTGDAV